MLDRVLRVANLAALRVQAARVAAPALEALGVDVLHRARAEARGLGQFFAIFCKFLADSFSAVSKRNFARKYAFDSIFQALKDLHPFAPLQSKKISKQSV